MYDNLGAQPGVPRPPLNPQSSPFENAFVGAGSGLIRGGLGAYGERILGSSSEYVQSNISRYFSDPQYYFQVNDHYVRNKLKVVLFPFLHRGHWTRITEPVGGRLSYKPPIYDINAPDLYIPLMAFGTYVVLAGFSLGLQGKFSPEALNWLFIKGLLGWFLQVSLLKMSLFSLGSGEAPLLDIVAYGGYSFTGMCLAVLGKIVWSYSYYFLMPWTCLCMGIYLVKTMKRVLFAEAGELSIHSPVQTRPDQTRPICKRMEKLISTRCNIQSVPESYILPVEIRPGNLVVVPLCKTIPVIDLQKLGHNQTQLIQQIIKASQEFGFFQLINHGVPEELMQDVLRVAKEFFELPAEDKASFYSEDPMQSCRLYTSIDYVREKVHFWRDNLRHSCHPLDDHMEHWPRNPARYREVVGSYSVEVRKLSMRLLELIGEGLGLERGYFFKDGLSQVQLMTLNHYPPCPDPSLVLGLPKHSDSNLITFLIQDEPGLQVLKDENWLALEPVPNSFVVNIGHMLQIISNGKLNSADHRVVTNARVGRTTVCSFIHPCGDTQIEPAQALLLLNKSKSNPPLYKAFLYKDFIPAYVADTYEGKPPLDRYKIHY